MLARLRVYFDDQLFVSSGRRMVATLRAGEIVAPVREALHLIETARIPAQRFDPATSSREFRLCMTDISQVTLLPRLLRILQSRARSVSLRVRELDEQTPELLVRGDADLAIGFLTEIGPGFFQQTLMEQTYVCVARKRHPRLSMPLRLADYLHERHIRIRALGTGHALIEAYLRRHRLLREVALTLPSFLGVGQIVARTDLIATVPAEMGRELEAANLCRVYPLPFIRAKFSVRQYWHARIDADPGHRWLRARVAEAFGVSTRQPNR